MSVQVITFNLKIEVLIKHPVLVFMKPTYYKTQDQSQKEGGRRSKTLTKSIAITSTINQIQRKDRNQGGRL